MCLDINRIKVLCFDIDGTMSNTDAMYALRIAKYLKPFRFMFKDHNEFVFAHWLVKQLEDPVNFFYNMPDKLGIDHQVSKFGAWMRRKKKERKKNYHLIIDGVEETLLSLSQHFRLASVTTRSERRAISFLDYFNLTSKFEAIATSLSAERMKPEPDPIFWVAEKLGISADSILMIGDTTMDILAGKRAGAQTVGVLSGFGQEKELIAAGADLILPSVAELPAVLFQRRIK